MIYYISGGERSGKSTFAQNLALKLSNNPCYLATARVLDKEMEERVIKHKNDRDDNWNLIEESYYLSKVDFQNKTVVIDCVTLWLTNIFFDNNEDLELSLKIAKNEINNIKIKNSNIIFVSNEIGMGLHGQTTTTRKFVQLQGWINQFIANKADIAYFMISGIPLKIKG